MYILLVIPFLAILLLLSVFLLIIRKWKVALGVFMLCVGINWVTESVPFNLNVVKRQEEIKLMSFNIHSGGQSFADKADDYFKLIDSESPDFVHLTEYFRKRDKTLDSLLKERYPYAVSSYGTRKSGERFYSKWKIDTIRQIKIDTLLPKVRQFIAEFPDVKKRLKYQWIYRVQISRQSKSIAIYCCHLQSNNYREECDSIEYLNSNKITSYSRILNAIKTGYKVRELEADAIYETVCHEELPFVVMGDMNDLSGSYAIRKIQSAALSDAWWQAGIGYGATFHDYGMRWRLDHVLYNKKLRLCDIKNVDTDLSDHNPLISSFAFE